MRMDRRQLITGLIALVAAPAIIRAGSLMPVKAMAETWPIYPDPFGYDYAVYFDGSTPVTVEWHNQTWHGFLLPNLPGDGQSWSS